jgi:hypothetical protein
MAQGSGSGVVPSGSGGISMRFVLILMSVVVVLFIVVYFAGRKAGKGNAWGLKDFGSIRRNTNPSQIPSGWSPDPLAKELYDVMDGIFTLDTTQNVVFSKLSALTDGQVRAVYVAFNMLPGVKKPDTLTTWINEEWGNGDAPKIAALARLQQLGLP